MQFSGNFKGGKPLFWLYFGVRAPLLGSNSTGPPTKILDPPLPMQSCNFDLIFSLAAKSLTHGRHQPLPWPRCLVLALNPMTPCIPGLRIQKSRSLGFLIDAFHIHQTYIHRQSERRASIWNLSKESPDTLKCCTKMQPFLCCCVKQAQRFMNAFHVHGPPSIQGLSVRTPSEFWILAWTSKAYVQVSMSLNVWDPKYCRLPQPIYECTQLHFNAGITLNLVHILDQKTWVCFHRQQMDCKQLCVSGH